MGWCRGGGRGSGKRGLWGNRGVMGGEGKSGKVGREGDKAGVEKRRERSLGRGAEWGSGGGTVRCFPHFRGVRLGSDGIEGKGSGPRGERI